MSLFDVIKYPISDKPTEAELKALPKEIYLEWCKIIFTTSRSPSIAVIVQYYYFGSNVTARNKDIAVLRKLILEYDNEHL